MSSNSVELLEHAIRHAKKNGFRVRTEALDSASGGCCRIGSTPYIFLDQASTADQQLTEIMKILRSEMSALSLPADDSRKTP